MSEQFDRFILADSSETKKVVSVALSAIPNGLKEIYFNSIGGKIVVTKDITKICAELGQGTDRIEGGNATACFNPNQSGPTLYLAPDKIEIGHKTVEAFGYLLAAMGPTITSNLAKSWPPALVSVSLLIEAAKKEALDSLVKDLKKDPKTSSYAAKLAEDAQNPANREDDRAQIFAALFHNVYCSDDSRAALQAPRFENTFKTFLGFAIARFNVSLNAAGKSPDGVISWDAITGSPVAELFGKTAGAKPLASGKGFQLDDMEGPIEDSSPADTQPAMAPPAAPPATEVETKIQSLEPSPIVGDVSDYKYFDKTQAREFTYKFKNDAGEEQEARFALWPMIAKEVASMRSDVDQWRIDSVSPGIGGGNVRFQTDGGLGRLSETHYIVPVDGQEYTPKQIQDAARAFKAKGWDSGRGEIYHVDRIVDRNGVGRKDPARSALQFNGKVVIPWDRY